MSLVKETYSKMKYWSGTRTLLTAADDDKIVESANMANAAYTIAAQPGFPAKLGFKVTAGDTADTMGIITVVGKLHGVDQTEVVVPVAGNTVYTTKFYDTVTSLTQSGWAIDEEETTNDTIIVGVLASGGVPVKGHAITVTALTGNVWINPNEVATATNGYLLTANVPFTCVVSDTLSVISDASGATFKYVIWME